ncbi:MAG: hypothetical protein ABJA84_03160 [Polaromonas sp.]
MFLPKGAAQAARQWKSTRNATTAEPAFSSVRRQLDIETAGVMLLASRSPRRRTGLQEIAPAATLGRPPCIPIIIKLCPLGRRALNFVAFIRIEIHDEHDFSAETAHPERLHEDLFPLGRFQPQEADSLPCTFVDSGQDIKPDHTAELFAKPVQGWLQGSYIAAVPESV